MLLKEYVLKLEILKNEIVGCDNLIHFYQEKKKQLQKEYENINNLELKE